MNGLRFSYQISNCIIISFNILKMCLLDLINKNLLQVLLKISLIKWMLTNSCNPVRRQHLTYSAHSTVSKSADFFSKPLDWFLYGRNSVLDVKKLAEKHRGIPSTYLKYAATWPFKFNMKHTWMFAFLKNLCNMKQGTQKTNQKVI